MLQRQSVPTETSIAYKRQNKCQKVTLSSAAKACIYCTGYTVLYWITEAPGPAAPAPYLRTCRYALRRRRAALLQPLPAMVTAGFPMLRHASRIRQDALIDSPVRIFQGGVMQFLAAD